MYKLEDLFNEDDIREIELEISNERTKQLYLQAIRRQNIMDELRSITDELQQMNGEEQEQMEKDILKDAIKKSLKELLIGAGVVTLVGTGLQVLKMILTK